MGGVGMRRGPSFNRSVGIAIIVTLVSLIAMIVIAFVTQSSFRIAGVVDVASAPEGEDLGVSFNVNPLAPIVGALVLAAVIWSVGAARARLSRREDP